VYLRERYLKFRESILLQDTLRAAWKSEKMTLQKNGLTKLRKGPSYFMPTCMGKGIDSKKKKDAAL